MLAVRYCSTQVHLGLSQGTAVADGELSRRRGRRRRFGARGGGHWRKMLCVVHPQSGTLQLGVSVDQQGLRLQPLQLAVLCLVQASILATPLIVQRLQTTINTQRWSVAAENNSYEPHNISNCRIQRFICCKCEVHLRTPRVHSKNKLAFGGDRSCHNQMLTKQFC